MLGDMLSVRAAAEKPPLSTTFTKVAMLVMRSMRSPDHAVKRAESSRRFALSSCQRSRLLTFSASANVAAPAGPLLGRTESEQANLDLRCSENCHQVTDTATTYGTPLVFLGPALRRAERMLRHAHRVQRRSGISLVCMKHHAAVETHALDDDGAVIGWTRLADRRASVSAHRDLIAGADGVTEGIGLRFHRERHGSRKHDRSGGNNRLS